ncbi:MAG: hypothetical protein M1817_006167 [Caeruleum heppii]|nr:MAG: hypothetical protein M1817_006167 [Caeruleum heppii]
MRTSFLSTGGATALLLVVSLLCPSHLALARTTKGNHATRPNADDARLLPIHSPAGVKVKKAAGSSAEKPPTRYGMLLFPGFEMLDVFGPLEALQMLSRQHQMDLSLISTSMDAVTTRPRNPKGNPKNSTFFPTVVPTHTLDTASDVEVLIVPGGIGSRDNNLNSTIGYIAKTFPKLQYLITVCTGARLATQAGVLDGKKATTNKASWAETTALSTKVDWIGQARWVVDGKVWSSSGISAGIDVTLAFIEHIHDKATATTIANLMEYEWHQDSERDPFAAVFNVTQS